MIPARSARLAWLDFLLVLSLAGCGLLKTPTPTRQADSAQANATLNALVTLTMASLPSQTAHPPLATLVPGKTPTPAPATPTPSATRLPPTPTATQVCDQAAAGVPIDVSIPDDSQMRPGQNFTKTWRLQNVGSCTWTSSYNASFFYGAQMDAPQSVPLTRDVPAGESVEIMVDMVAPLAPGSYQGNWKLRNPKGQLFGIGPDGDAPFWVRIVVIQVQTPTPTQTTQPSLTPSPTPSQTPTTPPPVLENGALHLQINTEVDLDTGTANPASGADMAYRKDAAGLHMLVPLNNAVFGLIGAGEPDVAACHAAAMSTASLAL